jgi:hypothetical protein
VELDITSISSIYVERYWVDAVISLFILLHLNMLEAVHRRMCVVDIWLRMSGAIHMLPVHAFMA